MERKKLFGIGTMAMVLVMAMASVLATPVQAAPNGISEFAVIREAYSWLGVPYKYGGESRSGVDCSGLVRQVYLRASGGRAYYKDRTAEQIRQASYPVYSPRPGDVIIFVDKKTGICTHVGIYIKPSSYGYWDAVFIHACYQAGSVYPKKVIEDRLYYSPYGTGLWYKYFNIYFARYNPDYWTS